MQAMKFTPTTLLLILFITNAFSQILENTTLYSVSTQGTDVLHRFSSDDFNWTVVGNTGTENLKALEFEHFTNTLYGIDEGKLGIIDLITGQFSSLGTVNSGEGAYGTLVLDDIEGLTYYSPSDVFYAVHRIPGFEPGTNDVLFQIDPTTGLIKKNAMMDPATGAGIDYVVIPEVFDGEDFDIDLFDVSGIAYNPYTGQLYALQTQKGTTILTELNIETGEVESVIFDIADDFVSDLVINNGELLAVTGIDDRVNSRSDQIIEINLWHGVTNILGSIDQSNIYQNFQSLASSYPINDLALKVTLNPNQTLPITEEDAVTFDVTIYNQGEVIIDEINLVSYISDDTYLDDTGWTLIENKAYKTLEQSLEPGASVTTTLQVEVKEDFEGEIRTAVEIQSAYSNAITDRNGNIVNVPDIDSYPDDNDDEFKIVDNDIKGEGQNKNEDEDDHDIEIVNAIINFQSVDCACFSVAQNNGTANELFGYNKESGEWYNIGKTGTTNLKALTYAQSTKTLFGIEQGKLGTIDIATGEFTGFGVVNSGEGEYGTLVLDDIQDLAFDMHHNKLYAVHRIPGNGPGTNDVIFKIDAMTGLIVKNGLRNDNLDSVDYVIIDEVFNTENSEDLYDISGISFDPYTRQFFAIHMQQDNSATQDYNAAVISELEIDSDEILLSSIIYDTPLSNMHDLSYVGNGEFYSIQSSLNQIIDFDRVEAFNLTTLSSSTISKIGPFGNSNNFQSLACSYSINDLALKVTLNPSQTLPITDKDAVTFDITIYNQGETTVDDINLASYISENVSVEDDSWIQLENTAYKSISQTIEPGESISTSLQLEVKENFEGELRTAVEIESVFSNSIFDIDGNPIPLQDIDSQPDDYDDEINISDDEIDGGGPNKGEDEDDHDIAIINSTINSQSSNCACYSVAQNNGYENELFVYNEASGNWNNIGKTGTNDLKALTYNQVAKTLYGIEKGKLGTVDVTTGMFNQFGVVNSGEGALGTLVLDDIQGLAYDRLSNEMLVVHSIPGEGPETNDVLFKIDPATGLIIKNAMTNPETGNTVDYVIIPEVFIGGNEFITDYMYDVSGITINPYTDRLWALQTQDQHTTLTELNKQTGEVESVILDTDDEYLSDIAINKNGLMYAVTGINEIDDSKSGQFINVDFIQSFTTPLGNISTGETSQNFQSLACQLPVNDLALQVTLSPHHDKPITEEVDITFDITIYNQGEVEINEFTLTGIISENMFIEDLGNLDDSIWEKINNRIYATFNHTILPGETFTTTIDGEVDEDFSGNITNSFEISEAYSNDFIDSEGNFILLADVDSQYDDDNNETNIVDDQIDGNGLHKNEDEDDHDIVSFNSVVYVGVDACACFSVAVNDGSSNNLFVYQEKFDEWYDVGITGTTNLKALAYVQKSQTLYGIDNGVLGYIDLQTSQFIEIGAIDLGEGVLGILALNDIEALTYDTQSEVLFAVHRMTGDGPGTNDILFQIDPTTGFIIKNAMTDPTTGNPADYVIIDEVFDGDFGGDLYDVSGLAYNNYTDELYALQTNQDGLSDITLLNSKTGELEMVVFDINDTYVSDIAFNKIGGMFATTGTNEIESELSDQLIEVDLAGGESFPLSKISSNGNFKNFQSLACQTPLNDLALKMEVAYDDTPFISGDPTFNTVFLDIEIFNQGEITIDEFHLVAYLPFSTTLDPAFADEGWTLNGTIASKNFQKQINPGERFTESLRIKIKDNIEGIVKVAAEIENAFSYDITDNDGKPLPLADIDSFYDLQNDELNIVDNEINGGGSSKNEDEDDHDIASFNVITEDILESLSDNITSPCYTIAHNNGLANTLSIYDPEKNIWRIVGTTGTADIKAIAIDDVNAILYAINKGILGTVNSSSGAFIPVGTVNTGNGDHGNLTLDDIYGLAYDTEQDILFASHRINGNNDDLSNDVIFQIDPATGLLIPGAMLDSAGDYADYAVVPMHREHGVGLHDLRDVSDLTINSHTGALYAMLSNNNVTNILFEINKQTAELEEFSMDWGEFDEIGSVSFVGENQLYTTLKSPNGRTELVLTDIETFEHTPLNEVDANNTITGFLSLDCSNTSVCVEERNISESLNGFGNILSGTYQASQTINSDGIIPNVSQNVTYKAGIEISLEPGFEVKQGSEFFADIENCE